MSGAGAIDPFKPWGKLGDNVFTPMAFPLGDCGFSEPTASEEYIDGHDEIHPAAETDVHFSGPDFVVGNGFDVSGQSTGLHERLQTLGIPSKRSITLLTLVNCKPRADIYFRPEMARAT